MLKIKLLSPSYKLQVSLSEKKQKHQTWKRSKSLGHRGPLRTPRSSKSTCLCQVHVSLPIRELNSCLGLRTLKGYKSLISLYKKTLKIQTHLYQVKGMPTEGKINRACWETHKQGTNTPIQRLVRPLFRVPDSRKPITWERMKFVLWAWYNKLSPFILISRKNFTFPVEASRVLSGWSWVCLRG